MANEVYTRDLSTNVAIISRKMRFELFPACFWLHFADWTTDKGRPVGIGNEPKAVEAPISVHADFKKEHGDVVKVPMLRRLVNLPRISTEQMKENEERFKVNHLQVPIDTVRHGVLPVEGKIMKQTSKHLELILNSKPALLRHYAAVEEMLQISYAFYYGFSYNLINSSRFTGHSTITSISHPNVFLAGQGRYEYSGANYPGTAGYETGLGTALGNIASNHIFNMDLLGALKAEQAIRKIPPIFRKDGKPFRIMAAHPWQISSLEQDSKFNATANAVFTQNLAKENPLITGASYFVHGFAIFENDTAVWPVSVSGGNPVWGPSTISDLTSFEDYSSEELFAAIILGSNCMARGVASNVAFANREDDYGHIIGIAYDVLEGCARADFFNDDDGTRGQYLINDTSGLLVTWAEKPSY